MCVMASARLTWIYPALLTLSAKLARPLISVYCIFIIIMLGCWRRCTFYAKHVDEILQMNIYIYS